MGGTGEAFPQVVRLPRARAPVRNWMQPARHVVGAGVRDAPLGTLPGMAKSPAPCPCRAGAVMNGGEEATSI